MRHKKWLFLFLILILASILRLYQLGKTPISLEWDEVSWGYDAYSLLKTGRDQYGNFLPLAIRSLDDYKPPVYEYLTIPSVALFGLNSFSTRFPSTASGIIAVLAIYFLAYLIISQIPTLAKNTMKISLMASFLMAISPWHLQLSRAAFEMNVSVCIPILSVVTFLYGLKNSKYLIISAILFGLDLFVYQSTRVVSPLLLLSLIILFHRFLNKKNLISFLLIYGIFILIFIPVFTSKDNQIRFKATNIFTPGARYLDEKDLEAISLDKRIYDKQIGYELAGKIFHNQRLKYLDYDTIKKSFGKYLSNFGFEFLFIKGDVPLHHAPGFGLLYIIEFPLIVIGSLYLLFKGLNRYSLIILLWVLFVPIPDAVTREAPQAVRTELFVPMFELLGALGLLILSRLVLKESRILYLVFVIVISTLFFINHSNYLHQYYIHTNYELSKNWLYGRKEAAVFTEEVKNNYDKIIVSLSVDRPYIFWLFYTQYPPEKYLREGGTISGGFLDEKNHFDKYEFRKFSSIDITQKQKILLVGSPNSTFMEDKFPLNSKVLKTIYYLDGTEAIRIAELNT